MASARNLKPGFFKNEDLAECNFETRLCFAGLWLLADREGRLEDRPKRIKGELFAFDSVDVAPMLDELERRGFILRYRAKDGRQLIQVLNFNRHQNPHHREPDSTLPAPDDHPGQCGSMPQKPEAASPSNPNEAQGTPEAGAASDATQSPGEPGAKPGNARPRSDLEGGGSRAESPISDPGSLIPDSGNPAAALPDDTGPTGASAKAERGKRLPADWVLPLPWGEWALQKYPHWTVDAVREIALKFRNRWVAKTGKDATKLDWLATWQNWCASDITQRQHPAPRNATAGSADKAGRLAARLSQEQRTIDAE